MDTTIKQLKFYSIDFEKDQDGGATGFKDIKINQLFLMRFLSNAGFRRFQLETNYFFIKLENNIASLVTEVDIRDYVFKEVRKLPKFLDPGEFCHRDRLENKLLTSVSTYFNKEKLYFLEPITAEQFNTDTHQTKFIYYQNIFVEITAGAITAKIYKSLDKYIWQDEILQREFIPGNIDIKSDTAKFFKFITGHRSQSVPGTFIERPERVEQLQNITGYLLHNYFDYKLKAILFTDSTITDDNEANGRTGKTLFCRMIAHTLSNNPNDPKIKTFTEINGKDFDPTDDKKFQSLSIETKLIHINDVKRYFDADALYNDITDGISVNKKFRDPFKLSVKIIVSTNKTIKLDGASSRDRFIEFQFGDYFSDQHSPEKEFNKWLFRDWNAEQWRQYDIYMQNCCLTWLQNLVLNEPDQINLKQRKLIDQTHPDFIDFMEELNPAGKEFFTSDLMENFLTKYPEHKEGRNALTTQRFKKWLQSFINNYPGLKPYNKKMNTYRQDNKHGVKFLVIE